MRIFDNQKWITIASWGAIAIWMLIIFAFSAQPADQSDELSKSVTKVILETIEQAVQDVEIDVEMLNHIVRKNAHFFTYLILGLLVANGMGRIGIRGARRILLSLGICILYAASDEIHQLFVPGRGAQVRDVMIDSGGAAAGIGIYLGLRKTVHLGVRWAKALRKRR